MRITYAHVISLLLGFAAESHAATANLYKDPIGPSKDEWSYTIRFNGEIDKNSPKQILKGFNKVMSLEHNSKGVIVVYLNSGGGDLEAGIEMGKIIREHEMSTVIPRGATCASSCGLAFLGGVSRMTWGRYGIHRPYANRYNERDKDARESFVAINNITGDYLAQMNITPRLLEAMNLVPSGDIRWLTEAERNDFGIDGSDPIFADRKSSEFAKKLGITKGELYSRQQGISSKCPASMPISEMERCIKDVYEGRR